MRRLLTLKSGLLAGAFLSVLVFMTGCGENQSFDSEKAVFSRVSGENAFEHVKKLVSFGPRPPGSEALEKSRQYIESELNKHGWQVKRQTFKTKTPDGPVEFTNLIVRFGPAEKRETLFKTPGHGLLCSHYDTKIFQGFEFVGANDGGSSSGLLIELARALADRPEIAEDIELVFFDGEEAFGTGITKTDGLYGSKFYAKGLVVVPENERPRWGILLDMVGDQDLKIRAGVQIPGVELRAMPIKDQPEHKVDSVAVRASLDKMTVWLLKSAEELGHRSKIGISPNYITDDHVPLNVAAGIPVIDLIDFDFDYWHTPGDTIDKISAESLEITGQVTLLMVEKYLVPGM